MTEETEKKFVVEEDSETLGDTNDEEVGGDSEEVGDDEVGGKRPEQDRGTTSKETGLPSPSTR